jgi:hypothetical protein
MIETPTYPAPPTMGAIVGNAVVDHVAGHPAASSNERVAGDYPTPPTMRSVVAALVDEHLRS